MMRTCTCVLRERSDAIHGKLSQLQDVCRLRFPHIKRFFVVAPKGAGETDVPRIAVMHLNHCLALVTVKTC